MSLPYSSSLPDSGRQSHDAKPSWFKRFSFPLLVLVGLLTVIIILWLPVGLNSPDNWDGWMFFARLDQGNSMLFNPNFPTRPFTAFPWIIAYLLSSNSFVGYNLVLMVLLLSKGLLTCAIVYQLLRGHAVLAFLCGLLSIVYPADTGVFFLSALNIHLNVCLFLLCFYLLLIYWKFHNLWALSGSVLALLGTIGIYEAAFPLAFAMPFILLWVDHRLTKRLVRLTAVWFLILGAAFIFNIIALRSQAAAYQSSLLVTNDNPLARFFIAGFYVYDQHFRHGFTAATEIVTKIIQGQVQPVFLILAMIAGTVSGLIVFRLQKTTTTNAFGYRLIRGLTAIGFIFILLGYVTYIPTSFLGTNWRTLFFSSWGASIFLACGFYFLGSVPKKRRVQILVFILIIVLLPFLVIDFKASFLLLCVLIVLLNLLPRTWSVPMTMSVFIGVGTLFYLDQHAFYDTSGRNQLDQLSQIVKQVPQAEAGTVFILIDEAGLLPAGASPMTDYPENFVYNYIFDSALKTVYQDSSFEGRLCHTYAYEVISEDCIFTEDGIDTAPADVVWFPSTQRVTYPYSKVLIFTISPDGLVTLQPEVPERVRGEVSIESYQPEALIDRDSVPPPRATTLGS